MSDKTPMKKVVFNMYKQEQKQIKKSLSNFVQPNQQINFESILKNKATYNPIAPTFTNEREKNMQKKKESLDLTFLNETLITTVQMRQRIVEDNNGLLFNKIDPVRQMDSKVTYSHYDTSILSFKRRGIEKIVRAVDSIPQKKKRQEELWNKIFGASEENKVQVSGDQKI